MLKWLHILLSALLSIRRNILRSALTTLGIVIGVGAVIAMMEIGNGSAAAVRQSIASLGANMLMVMPGAAASGGQSWGSGSVMTLTPSDAEAIAKECPSVRAVASVVRLRSVQVVYGNANWVPMECSGSTEAFFAVREWKLSEGEPFSAHDVRNGANVCVIGQTVAKQLFGKAPPIGKEIRVQGVTMRVVGVLAKKGANMMGRDQDDTLVLPWTTAKFRVSGAPVGGSGGAMDVGTAASDNNALYPGSSAAIYPQVDAIRARNSPLPVRFVNVDQIITAAASTEQIPSAIEEITRLLHERHRIGPDGVDDFNIRDITEMGDAMTESIGQMTRLLMIVAAISLVVGGVGIMNIMLVSVTERTREIGLRMAVGARSRDILWQFLAEAVVLCLGGGVMGILLGRGCSMAVKHFVGWPIESSLVAITISVGVSALVGILFGFYPAWKASRLDPIEALRYE